MDIFYAKMFILKTISIKIVEIFWRKLRFPCVFQEKFLIKIFFKYLINEKIYSKIIKISTKTKIKRETPICDQKPKKKLKN